MGAMAAASVVVFLFDVFCCEQKQLHDDNGNYAQTYTRTRTTYKIVSVFFSRYKYVHLNTPKTKQHTHTHAHKHSKRSERSVRTIILVS